MGIWAFGHVDGHVDEFVDGYVDVVFAFAIPPKTKRGRENLC